MTKRSDTIVKGHERAPHRSLLHAVGVKSEDFGKPFIAVCNCARYWATNLVLEEIL